MSSGSRSAGLMVVGIGLGVLGVGLIQFSHSVNNALPVLSATTTEVGKARQDLKHVQDTLPSTAKDAGGEFVKGATQQVVKTAVDPTGAVVDTVIHDKPTADVVKVITNPVGFIASKIF